MPIGVNQWVQEYCVDLLANVESPRAAPGTVRYLPIGEVELVAEREQVDLVRGSGLPS
jgi:hypothetical protein